MAANLRRLIWKFIFLLVTGVAPVFANSPINCSDYPERQIIDGLLNLEFKKAYNAANLLDSESTLIPSQSFYRELIRWYEGVANLRDTSTHLQRSALTNELSLLKQIYENNPTIKNRFALNLATALVARAFLANKQVSAAYKIGLKAIENLETDIQDPALNTEQRAAGKMMIGLYYLYSNFIPDQFSWLKSSVLPKGSFEKAVYYLTESLTQSAIFSPEAGRTLVVELPWRTPEHCLYINLSTSLSATNPGNTDISLVFQGLAIRCGYLQLAETENLRLSKILETNSPAGYEKLDYRLLNLLAKYRLNANRGIQNHPSANDKYTESFRLFANANAYDVTNERKKAIQLYRSLSMPSQPNRGIRVSASTRIKTPFEARETIYNQSSPTLLHCS